MIETALSIFVTILGILTAFTIVGVLTVCVWVFFKSIYILFIEKLTLSERLFSLFLCILSLVVFCLLLAAVIHQ